MFHSLSALSNSELLDRLKQLRGDENQIVADVVLHLSEVDSRGIFRDAGYSSLFVYCRESLGCSEGSAFRRVRAARCLRQSPELYELIRTGKITLSAISEVSPVLTSENKAEVISAATGASKREAEQIAVRFGAAKAPKRETIRVQKVAVNAEPDLFSGIAPIRPESPKVERRVDFAFAVTAEVAELYEQAKAMIGPCKAAEVFEKAIREYISRRTAKPKARARKIESHSNSPEVRPGSHSVPPSVRHEVFERDGRRCAYVSPDGVRCCSRDSLQIDHVVPVARGGTNEVENLRVLCCSHNQLLAEQWFGRVYVEERRNGGGSTSPAKCISMGLEN